MWQGGFRIDDVASSENHLTLQGDLYGSDVNVAAGGNGRANGANVLGRWTHTISDDSDTTLQLYYDRTYLSDPISSQFGTADLLTDNLDTYDLDFQHRFSLGDRNRIVWGLGYRFTHDVVGEAQNLAFLPPVLDQNLFSGFIQDEIMIVKDLHFTIGTKLEHNDYTGFEVEPSARLQWNLAHDQMLWGAVSRAVRTPSRVDRDTSEPAPSSPPVVLQGSPNFESETLIAYELGYRAQLGPKVNTSISAFYNDYDDIRSVSATPNTILPLFFANNLQGYTYGIEISANYQACDWWRLHAGYDLLEEHLRVKPGQMDINDAHNETADPKHQFSLRSSMDLVKNVELDAGLRFVDTLLINNGPTLGKVPAYFELDARLSWHATDRLEFSIVGQNLLHTQHQEYGFPGSPSTEDIVRSVYGKVAWQF
ncbi:MAG: TonB-dependent receptor, partial [Chthoniobacteraceae bacterium]